MSTIDRAKKKHLRREKIARLSTSIVFRSIHSLDIYVYIYIYFFVCVCVSFLHLSLLSHPIDYIRLYRAPQYDPKDLFSARA